MNKIIILAVAAVIVIGAAIYFMQSNNAAPQNQQQTPSAFDIQGMKVEILQQGSGPEAKSGDKVTVNYVGTLQNGTKFDSSIDRNQPFQFNLGAGQVIKGWDLGVAGMKVGEKRRLTIPPELGYGSQAVGGVIPANSTLIFEVTLLGINQ